MKKYLLALLLLSGCAPLFQGEGLKIDPTFEPYVARFTEEAAKSGHPVDIQDLTIEFDDNLNTPNNQYGGIVLGLCSRDGRTNPKITINTTFWKRMKNYPADLEQLMFHELGHCVLNREHNDGKIQSADSGVIFPVSVMNPYHFGGFTYGVNYNYYMNELFGNSPAPVLYTFGQYVFNNNWYLPASSVNAPVSKKVEEATVVYPDENGEYDFSNIHCGDH